jgi:pimeloyl-ACP methyl ester carboxylesterase
LASVLTATTDKTNQFMNGLCKRALWVVAIPVILISVCFGQSSLSNEQRNTHLRSVPEPAICGESEPDKARSALRLVCERQLIAARNNKVRNSIVIGFVGGFVKPNDMKHPEVQFASWLRESYPSIQHIEVFSNHGGKHALRRVLQLLDTDGDGLVGSDEKERADIIIYGHSWGGSQAVTLSQELGRADIPVSLAILVDSVHKPGRNDAVIPPNVLNAVNFYQTKSLIHGRSRIRIADPKRTNMIGNFHMIYQNSQINCDNYPWIARHLNRGHHEIENDPQVWDRISSLIDAELFEGTLPLEASLPTSRQELK